MAQPVARVRSGSVASAQPVVAGPADDGVGARTAVDGIPGAAAAQTVVVGAAVNRVFAGPADDGVVADTARQRIVAAPAVQ